MSAVVNGSDIVAEARRWIGTPYRHQGGTLGIGCDCLGLVLGIWRALAGEPPVEPGPYTRDWAEAGKAETMLDAAEAHMITVEFARPGDVLVFRWRPHLPAKHAAIVAEGSLWRQLGSRFAGHGRMVHAYDGAGKVAEGAVHRQWRARIAGAFRFPFVEPS